MKNKPASEWEPGIGELEDMRRRGTLNARAASKVAAPPGAFSVAGCSPAVPVCELEKLAESWLHRHATTLGPTHNLLYCRDELRRLIEAAKERQPQENVKAEPRPL